MGLELLRAKGWPFYVRTMVPDRGDDLFPAKFAFKNTCQEGHDDNSQQGHLVNRSRRKRKHVSEADLSTVDPNGIGESDADEFTWDIFDEDSDLQSICPEHEHGD